LGDKRIPAARICEVWLDPALTTAQAALAVGLSRSNLWRRAKALGLPARPVGNVAAIRDDALFARLWAAGVSMSAMAEYFGCHQTTIFEHHRRLGLPPRPIGGRKPFRSVRAFVRETTEARLAERMALAARTENAAAGAKALVPQDAVP
jgi:hypothetical protein